MCGDVTIGSTSRAETLESAGSSVGDDVERRAEDAKALEKRDVLSLVGKGVNIYFTYISGLGQGKRDICILVNKNLLLAML